MANKMKLIVDGDVFLIKENPDTVVAKRGWESKEGSKKGLKDAHVNDRKKIFSFYEGTGYAFGYSKDNDEMLITKKGGTHGALVGARNLRCAGRFWIDKAIISFWKYPKNRADLKKTLHDLEKAFNDYHLDNRGVRISPEKDGKFYTLNPTRGNKEQVETRASELGVKLNFHGGWLMDIPATNVKYDKDVGGKGYDVVQNVNGNESYLYSFGAIFSNMKLSGPWGGDDETEIDTDDGQEHVKSPLLKMKGANKLSSKQLRDLYDWMKIQDKMSPEEVKLYNMLARHAKGDHNHGKSGTYQIPVDPNEFEHWYKNTFEGIEAYVGNGRVYMRENSKDPFTTMSICAIILEAPHIEVGHKVIDLEFEAYDQVEALKRIVRAVMKEELTDKYGSRFRLTSDSEVSEFIKKIMRNPQVKRMVD